MDVGELLGNIAADVAIEADAQGCLVKLQSHGRLPVSGDPELLRSAFENVIRNAVRYSPRGALVVISARRVADAAKSDTVEVAVRDSGPGVPEEDLALIFEPFYRVDAARGHHGIGGEGLGLAIAARALAVHGGTIAARNVAGGFAMIMNLPVIDLLPAELRGTSADVA